MVDQLRTSLQAMSVTRMLVLGFALLVVGCIWLAAATGYYVIAGAPAFLLVIYLSIVDFRIIFWLLVACIPISTEISLPGGVGTDLPTEPLIIGLMLIFGLFAAKNIKSFSGNFLHHPITLVLLLHVSWLLITTITSGEVVVSIKFLLAKIWYVTTFFFLAGYLLRSEQDYRRFFWVFYWPAMLVVGIILLRHASYGFSFVEIHSVLHPFQRNHVNYAASLALFLPMVFFAAQWYDKRSWKRWLLYGTIAFLLGAVYLTYTRAAYVSLVIAAGAYFVIRWRLMRYVLIIALIGALVAAVSVIRDNAYLEYAPNYERTVSHEKFDNLIEATYKMEDISTMERVYRWVAAGHMIPERPLFGWGPGNFVNFYKPFAVTSFQTYVSDNPEKSGIHSYFLMTLVEQGFPGLIIFVSLLVVTLMRGESMYHQLAAYPGRQRIVMMTLLSSIVIYAFLLINDLVETDKIGSFFFIHLAVLVNQELFLLRQRN